MASVKSMALAAANFLFLVAPAYLFAIYLAYTIRLYAIEVFGRVIHEFDPWFNFRATEYLAANGLDKFFKWFDHQSWYPLGRPVGTTIYPGMQMVAVALWKLLKLKQWKTVLGFSVKMSLNDVCVFMPAWFGAVASVIVGLLTTEASGSSRAGAAAALVMAVVPAHLMRSIGGGYDNESVAMTAMVLTFYLWVRSLRSKNSWWIGFFAGLAYAFMAAAWGGYIFVGNMVAVHAAALIALGHFTPALHASYSLWFLTGTLVASYIPVVGWAPYRSLEQAAPLLVFLGMHLLRVIDYFSNLRYKLTWESNFYAMLRLRVFVVAAVGGICSGILVLGMATGHFGGLSVRVRSLFLKHTKTGNPLVDSVAEHQAASTEAYKQYLHHALPLAAIGFVLLLLKGVFDAKAKRSSFGVPVSKWFIILYAVVGYYFSAKMSRLIILLGPVASALAGVAIAATLEWCFAQVLAAFNFWSTTLNKTEASAEAAPAPEASSASTEGTPSKAKKATASTPATPASAAAEDTHPLAAYRVLSPLRPSIDAIGKAYASQPGLVVRLAVAVMVVFYGTRGAPQFYSYSNDFAKQISQPSLMFRARLQNGQDVIVNDYQEAYWWLRDNTPADSRVLSWWDYGYQIAGIANRTTLADGNTWNLEHIALIGRIMTSPERRAHELAKHLADYVLVWAGNGGDDLAKSPHMARIGSSVFPDICPKDPLCRNFGFYQNREPTPSMAASLLYKLHSSGINPKVAVDSRLFEHVYTSKYGLVRVYKVVGVDMESREWAADPSNRICDAPGSWYCVGQYPPKLPLAIPKSHRHVDYDNPDSYVEEMNGGEAPPQQQAASKSSTEGRKRKGKKKAAAEEL